MHAAVQPDSNVAPRIALLRTSIGLAQGLVLYLLYLVADNDVWPATETLLFAPMLLVALFCPLLLVSALGHLTRRQVMLWVGGAAILIAALAVYDIWRMGTQLNLERRSHVAMPSPPFIAMLVAALFIAHALVLSGARDRRRIAAYTTYFDIAWKLGVQLAFSAFFVGITWLALQLGTTLFELVRLNFFAWVVRPPWFAIPVTAFAFSCAMHLTDVRPAIVQGIRGLLLMLASWILPVFTLFVAGFLASLPFTGLEPLWATRQAAAVLLCTDAALVILINAAWQNGSAVVARIIRLSAQLASLLLVPVTAIAVYALALRVGDHGWTNERIVAAACMLVASCYALGYAAAVVRPRWVVSFAGVNVGTAFVVLATLLLLFSPLPDPARLSVNDQLARLASGRVSAQDFDFEYLQKDGKRFGREALVRLDSIAGGPNAALIRRRIAAASEAKRAWMPAEGRPDAGPQVAAEDKLDAAAIAPNLRMQPQGSRLPEGFLQTDWTDLPQGVYGPDCLHERGQLCDVYQLDLDGDGKPELLLVAANGARALVVKESADGKWQVAATGQLGTPRCGRAGKATPADLPRAVRREWADIEFGSRRFSLAPVTGPYAPCPDE